MEKLPKAELLEILKKFSWQEIEKLTARHVSTADGKEYFSFNSFFQRQLPFFVQVKFIIRTLEHIFSDPKTTEAIKANLEKIFAAMDPRDQCYRWGDCNCSVCKPRGRRQPN